MYSAFDNHNYMFIISHVLKVGWPQFKKTEQTPYIFVYLHTLAPATEPQILLQLPNWCDCKINAKIWLQRPNWCYCKIIAKIVLQLPNWCDYKIIAKIWLQLPNWCYRKIIAKILPNSYSGQIVARVCTLSDQVTQKNRTLCNSNHVVLWGYTPNPFPSYSLIT